MADADVVLSNPLCFLVNKFGKCQVKQLKSVLVDFYSPDVLSEAKTQLLKDIEKVKSVISFPHIPQHRQGDNRAVRDVDDMVLLLTSIDEQGKDMSKILPAYVSNGPDNMPSLRLYEGDFGVIMSLLEKMETRLSQHGVVMSSIAQDVHNIRQTLNSPEF